MNTLKDKPWFNYPQYSWHEKTATVIGAGIAGCQIAWHLAKRGWKVTVIERNSTPAQEASGNVAGIISPKVTAQPSLGEDFYLQSYHSILHQLQELPAESLNWHPVGVLQLATKERAIKRWLTLQARNFSTEILRCLSAQEASQMAGIPIPHQAVFFPQAGWIEPISLCNTLLFHPNIKLITNTQALQLRQNKNEWGIINSSKQVITQSEAVIISSGKNLNFTEIEALPTIPISGQTTLAKAGKYAQQLRTVIDHDGYITPIINHQQQLLFGATYQRESLDSSCQSEANQKNIEKQKRILAELASDLYALKNGHAAIRMVTPDRFPYLGAVPKIENYKQDYGDIHHGKHWKQYPNSSYYSGLFVSAAYGSHGLTTTGLCAEILACLINNEKCPVSKELRQALHPARFCIRELKALQQHIII